MSKIEWTEKTWNPITGCTKVSPGCKNCYAERMAKRLAGRYGYPKDDPFFPTIHYDKLSVPHSWKSPKMIFVCSMSDLFHEEFQGTGDSPWLQWTLFKSMKNNPKHIFQILTKRPRRALKFYLQFPEFQNLPNVWQGVSVEDQNAWLNRVPVLVKMPVKTKFISLEPLLEMVDMDDIPDGGDPEKYPIDWIIVGGESGPGKRPFDLSWARDIRDRCNEMGVPFFMKQVDKKIPIPEDLKIREYPK